MVIYMNLFIIYQLIIYNCDFPRKVTCGFMRSVAKEENLQNLSLKKYNIILIGTRIKVLRLSLLLKITSSIT